MDRPTPSSKAAAHLDYLLQSFDRFAGGSPDRTAVSITHRNALDLAELVDGQVVKNVVNENRRLREENERLKYLTSRRPIHLLCIQDYETVWFQSAYLTEEQCDNDYRALEARLPGIDLVTTRLPMGQHFITDDERMLFEIDEDDPSVYHRVTWNRISDGDRQDDWADPHEDTGLTRLWRLAHTDTSDRHPYLEKVVLMTMQDVEEAKAKGITFNDKDLLRETFYDDDGEVKDGE